MALALVFPGQGSQAPGMGRDLAAAFPVARQTFEEVDEALKQKLSVLMFEGPADQLTLTANAQPALMAHSLAVLRVLEQEGGFDLAGRVALVAGHSLGEYSALTAARAFDLGTAARLLRLRGEAMQKATPAGTGAMAALLGAELEQAQALCAAHATDPATGKAEVLEVANDNGGGQVVISGAKAAVDRAIAAAPAAGIKRALPLPVSAPFHCALMAPAAEVMAEALERAPIAAPVVPVIANVTAAKATDPAMIRDLLVAQVTATVRWRECVAAMAAMGCDRFAEIGAGKVLTGLMKRNAPDATATAIGTAAEVEAFLKTL
jgi:[acyl-carrier-protein] S-malonyltransferase